MLISHIALAAVSLAAGLAAVDGSKDRGLRITEPVLFQSQWYVGEELQTMLREHPVLHFVLPQLADGFYYAFATVEERDAFTGVDSKKTGASGGEESSGGGGESMLVACEESCFWEHQSYSGCSGCRSFDWNFVNDSMCSSGDWNDDISSIWASPDCWSEWWENINGGGDSLVLAPWQAVGSMGGWNDRISSMENFGCGYWCTP